MDAYQVLISILSGFGIIGFLLIFKLLRELSKVQVDLKVAKINCQKDLDRLEDRITKHVNHDTKRLNDEISRLQKMQSELLTILDKHLDTSTHNNQKEILKG
jgi:predicted PurR-regulated permease PerM